MSVVAFPSYRADDLRFAPCTEVHRLSLPDAADWQQQIIAECRRQRSLSPAVFAFLKSERLLNRCTFLASERPAAPLLFKYIGAPTLSVLGRAWGRSMLNQPEEVDPHAEFAHSIGLQYVEAICGGEALFNKITVTGLGRPFVYTHAVYGWAEGGRRAVLSAVDVQTLH